MAFNYEAGTAADVADWFTKLEAFMLTLGWTIESGSGTQTVVFKSIGEGGGRVKLHCRLRQDGGSPEYVYTRVQDDIAGTNTTTEDMYSGQLDAGGGGAAPFDYWMVGDRDCLIVVFLTGATYTLAYVGIAERFAVTVPDEEYEMVSCGKTTGTTCGRVLRRWDHAWDQWLSAYTWTTGADKNPMDNSYPLAGAYLRESTTDNDKHLGQMKHITGQMAGYAGLNAGDTIATAFGGATSWWTVLGVGATRFAIHTGGNLPVGAWEGGFSYTSGVAADIDDLNTKFKAFVISKGWTEVANPSPGWPIDYYLNSPGQLAGDDIWLRWRYDTAQGYWGGYVMDDAGDAHNTGYIHVGDNRLWPADFPLNYFIGGDADCFVHGVEIASVWYWGWFGMFTIYMGDPGSIDTTYKVGIYSLKPSATRRILRGWNGTWSQTISERTDRYGSSSPNALDGTTYVIWPLPLYHAPLGDDWEIGQPKYVHRLSSTALAVNDTVTIGARRYLYIGGNIAVRDI